jgi:hypothetical protein
MIKKFGIFFDKQKKAGAGALRPSFPSLVGLDGRKKKNTFRVGR